MYAGPGSEHLILGVLLAVSFLLVPPALQGRLA